MVCVKCGRVEARSARQVEAMRLFNEKDRGNKVILGCSDDIKAYYTRDGRCLVSASSDWDRLQSCFRPV